MDRRTFLACPGGWLLVTPIDAGSQQAAVVPRLGYLALNLYGAPRLTDAFRRGLRNLGHVEGRNIAIEYWDAEGESERPPDLAADLVRLKVDVIVTVGALPALAALDATRTLPIVFIGAADPVTSGIVSSLAQPGGNVTGLSLLLPELVGKRLELFKQAVPGISRIAVLWQPGGSGKRTERDLLRGAEAAARALGLQLLFVEARSPADIDRAFTEMTRMRAEALTVLSTPMFGSEQRRLVDLAAKNRLPTVFQFRQYVDAGGLMSYGPDLTELYWRAATYVDRILKGAKPTDLPVEQRIKFELVINMKTARALGLTIPKSLLARADEVIE